MRQFRGEVKILPPRVERWVVRANVRVSIYCVRAGQSRAHSKRATITKRAPSSCRRDPVAQFLKHAESWASDSVGLLHAKLLADLLKPWA